MKGIYICCCCTSSCCEVVVKKGGIVRQYPLHRPSFRQERNPTPLKVQNECVTKGPVQIAFVCSRCSLLCTREGWETSGNLKVTFAVGRWLRRKFLLDAWGSVQAIKTRQECVINPFKTESQQQIQSKGVSTAQRRMSCRNCSMATGLATTRNFKS